MYVFENGKIINKKTPQKNLTVMFIGQFCVGKSTLINALLRRQLLKTSIMPETAVLTKIVNGKSNDSVMVTFRDPERPDVTIPYEEYKKEFRLDGREFDKFKEISYVTLTAEMQNEAVTFIDSPANAIAYTLDEDIISLAQKADVVVMVLSALSFGLDTERECIQKLFAGRGLHNVFFAVNWYNGLRPEDDKKFSEHLKDVIGCVFTDADGNFNEELYKHRVFPIDAYTSECARTGSPKAERKGVKFVETPVDPEKDAYTGVPELEQALNQYLEQLRHLNINRLETGKIISKTAKKATEEKPSREFQVMFVGGFATGKSTLVNALLRRKLLKTSFKPETAVLTKIVNGKSDDFVTVTFRDPERPDATIPYEEYKEKFRLDEWNYFNEISYVTVTAETQDKAVTFIDSPANAIAYTLVEDTISLARKADVVVMVLCALKIGSDMEREFIQKLFAGRGVHNVFFAVNWYNGLRPEDDKEFSEHLKDVIGCVFTDADGNFNEELYKQRVFPIDAYTSECARTGSPKAEKKGVRSVETPVDPEEDTYTGVPELEQALNQYLEQFKKLWK
mgnify:CR=1 FL=1